MQKVADERLRYRVDGARVADFAGEDESDGLVVGATWRARPGFPEGGVALSLWEDQVRRLRGGGVVEVSCGVCLCVTSTYARHEIHEFIQMKGRDREGERATKSKRERQREGDRGRDKKRRDKKRKETEMYEEGKDQTNKPPYQV